MVTLYYEGKWWAYKEIEFPGAPVDTWFNGIWSERVELKDFQQFYDEGIKFIEPKVLIDNCPEQNIAENLTILIGL